MKPHRTDGVSLSFGVLFLLVAVWWAVSRVMTIHLPAVGWMVAGGLIAFGVIGLLGALRSGRRPAPQVEQPEPAQPVMAGDLPPEMHASIVQELLSDPAGQFRRDHPDAGAGADSGHKPDLRTGDEADRTPDQGTRP